MRNFSESSFTGILLESTLLESHISVEPYKTKNKEERQLPSTVNDISEKVKIMHRKHSR